MHYVEHVNTHFDRTVNHLHAMTSVFVAECGQNDFYTFKEMLQQEDSNHCSTSVTDPKSYREGDQADTTAITYMPKTRIFHHIQKGMHTICQCIYGTYDEENTPARLVQKYPISFLTVCAETDDTNK